MINIKQSNSITLGLPSRGAQSNQIPLADLFLSLELIGLIFELFKIKQASIVPWFLHEEKEY